MAETFYNARLAATTSYADIYTCPASATCLVLTCRATNIDGTNDATVSIRVLDSDGSTATRIAETINVPADTSLEIAGTSKIVLETGDKLQGLASAASDIEIFASVLTLT